MRDLLIRNIRVWPRRPDGSTVDVLCRDGRIAEIGPGLDAPGCDVVDGKGDVLIPAFTDAHAHLDSTRLGLPFRPHTAQRTLESFIDNDRRNWREAEKPVAERATHTLGATVAHGSTRVRSHAQVDPDSGLERLEGVLAACEAHAGRVDLEVVAFPQAGILREPGTPDLLDQALRLGADLVGGLDPEGFDGDADGHLDIVFALADRHGVGIDIHLHDRGELGARQIENTSARAKVHGGPVNISHCFALTTVELDRTRSLIDSLAESGVSLTTVAPATVPPLPLEALASASVPVGLGQDGIRDYWSPYGNGDMLERAWQLAFTNGYRSDELIERCVEVASTGGATIMGKDQCGLGIGDMTDLVIVAGDTVTAAVMDRAPRSFVIKGGLVVASNGHLI